MSLSSGKPTLASAIKTSWEHLDNQPENAAADIADAAKAFAMTGIPMTSVTGTEAAGQTVALALTTTPGSVSGSGVGGIDSSSPGAGLATVKATLVSSLTSLFTDTSKSAEVQAGKFADAANTFLAAAKVMTNVSGTAPPGQAAPPPAGPLGPGPWSGTGTGGLESSSGAGLSSGMTDLKSALKTAFANLNNTPADAANAIADGLEAFFKTAKVDTIDTGTAAGGVCVVAPPPAAPAGSTTGPSPATGTGTGTIS